jgi:hypothetical protein
LTVGFASTTNKLVPAQYAGDLNSLTYSNYATRVYYAGGGNTCTNTPNGNEGYGLLILRTAGGYTGQILMTPYNRLYIRSHGSNTWTAWDPVLTASTYSETLDSRYYTKSQSDERFVNVTGDTMTNTLHNTLNTGTYLAGN